MATATRTLHRRDHALSHTEEQLRVLDGGAFADGTLPTFADKLRELGRWPLLPGSIRIFQVNVGYQCNQTCRHCHVDAGPDRKEVMDRETLEQCVEAVRESGIPTVDITGGAPEMNPHFRWFVGALKEAGAREVIVRSNLTIFSANPKYHDLPEFFRDHGVRVVSSLPFYTADRTDRQRGEGVFERSIAALRRLNEVGYGMPDNDLVLDLVYNPVGAFLPGGQKDLEAQYKRSLERDHGIVFNSLFTITNMPISRFLEFLLASGNYDDYLARLVNAFNPATVDGVMCRDTISVGWDGKLFDCDFNQMLDLPLARQAPQHVRDFDREALERRAIRVSQHCYGCTAGAGSSCQGEVA